MATLRRYLIFISVKHLNNYNIDNKSFIVNKNILNDMLCRVHHKVFLNKVLLDKDK